MMINPSSNEPTLIVVARMDGKEKRINTGIQLSTFMNASDASKQILIDQYAADLVDVTTESSCMDGALSVINRTVKAENLCAIRFNAQLLATELAYFAGAFSYEARTMYTPDELRIMRILRDCINDELALIGDK